MLRLREPATWWQQSHQLSDPSCVEWSIIDTAVRYEQFWEWYPSIFTL